MAILENETQFLDYWYKLRERSDELKTAASEALQGKPIAKVIKHITRKRKHQWTPDQDKLLGTETDAELALQWGMSGAIVAARRKLLGRSLSVKSDRIVESVNQFLQSKVNQTDSGAVLRPQWPSDDEALLGTDTDGRIARKLNRPLQSVKDQRRLLGIATYKKHA